MRRVNARTLWLVMASLSLLVLASCGCGSGDRVWKLDVDNQLSRTVIIETDYFGRQGEGHFYTIPGQSDCLLPGDHDVAGLDQTFPIFDSDKRLIGSVKLTGYDTESKTRFGTLYLTVDQKCVGDMPAKIPGIDPVARRADAGVHFDSGLDRPIRDHLRIVDALGTKYKPATATDPFAFGAQYGYTFDRETGLYSCGERYYEPARGRWTTGDLAGPAGGQNLYSYCGDDPIGQIDPSGRQMFEPGPATAMIGAQFMGCSRDEVMSVGRNSAFAEVAGLSSVCAPAAAPEAVIGAGSTLGRFGPLVPLGGAALEKVEESEPDLIAQVENSVLECPMSTPGRFAGQFQEMDGTLRYGSAALRNINNANGAISNCHFCDAETPGTRLGNWICDRIPPDALNPGNLT